MRKFLYLVILAFLFSSCGDSEDVASVGATGTVPSQNGQVTSLPLLLQTAGGSLDSTGNKIIIRLSPSGDVQVGDLGEGGAIALSEFLRQTQFSESAPRAAEMLYVANGQSRFLPIFIESADQEGDGTLVLTAVGRPELVEDSVLAQGLTTGNISATVNDTAGARLPGATVRAEPGNRLSVTSAQGVAGLFNLPAGRYTVTADLEGFASQSRDDVIVKVAQTTRLTFTLAFQTVEQVDSATVRFLPEGSN